MCGLVLHGNTATTMGLYGEKLSTFSVKGEGKCPLSHVCLLAVGVAWQWRVDMLSILWSSLHLISVPGEEREEYV